MEWNWNTGKKKEKRNLSSYPDSGENPCGNRRGWRVRSLHQLGNLNWPAVSPSDTGKKEPCLAGTAGQWGEPEGVKPAAGEVNHRGSASVCLAANRIEPLRAPTMGGQTTEPDCGIAHHTTQYHPNCHPKLLVPLA